MFRTLQAAHDAASAGDIIYVEPSYQGTASYGSLICTKTLKIFGNGYFQPQNTSITQPWQQFESRIGILTINSGNNSRFEGLTVGTIYLRASNVTITRCRISSDIRLERNNASEDPSGSIISHNFFPATTPITLVGSTSYNAPTCNYTGYRIQNVIISNNIGFRVINSTSVSSGGSCTPAINPQNLPTAYNIQITNNTFKAYGTNQFVQTCQNCTVHSNIFSNTSTAGIFYDCFGCASSYNVCGTNPCLFGSNNVNSANENLIFTVTNASVDFGFQLPNTSPAKNAGLAGVDAGAFGTNDPYRLSGLAPIPQITSYSKNASSGVYTTTTPMTVTISVRGNN